MASRKAAKFLWHLTILFAVGVIIFWAFLRTDHRLKAKADASTATFVQPVTASAITKMGTEINSLINANSNVDIAVSVVDLKTNQTYNYGVNDVFEGASVGKLFAAGAYLKEVENGQASLSDNLGDDTAQDQLQAMIVNSDDNAWQLFYDQIGDSGLQDFAQQAGITDYNVEANTFTASDAALLLQKLYEGQLLDSQNTQLLLGYMAQANYTDYIVAAVPAGVKVYHKAGVLDDRIHDAAIIDDSKHPYVLVIFTNGHGTYDDTVRTQLLRDITQTTVNTFIRSS